MKYLSNDIVMAVAGTNVMLFVLGPLFLFRQQTGRQSPLNYPHCTVPNMAGAMII